METHGHEGKVLMQSTRKGLTLLFECCTVNILCAVKYTMQGFFLGGGGGNGGILPPPPPPPPPENPFALLTFYISDIELATPLSPTPLKFCKSLFAPAEHIF